MTQMPPSSGDGGSWPPPAPAPPPPVPPAQIPPTQWQPAQVQPTPWQPGASQSHQTPVFTPQPPPPMNPKTKRRLIGWVVTVLVLGLLVSGAAVTVHVMNQGRDPALEVRQYLEYLAAGDADAASEMVDPGLSGDQAILLTSEALGAATERITIRSVETISRSGGEARVRAKLALGRETFEHTFTVDRGAREWLVLDTWVLSEPLLADVWFDMPGVEDMGVTVTADDVDTPLVSPVGRAVSSGTREVKIAAYPGTYVISATAGAYFEPGVENVRALPGLTDNDYPEVYLWLEPSAQFHEEVLAQTRQYAEGCVSVQGNRVVRSNMDSLCPEITQNTRLDSLKVTEVPTELWGLNYWNFETEAFTFEVLGNTRSAEPQTGTYALWGGITWKDGKPLIEYAYFEEVGP